jgi:hypothetical protein
MGRKLFPGRPFPSRSRGWLIASAIDHVSAVRNKVLDEQSCSRGLSTCTIMSMHIVNCHLERTMYITEYRERSTEYPDKDSELHISSSIQYPHATSNTKSFSLPVSLDMVT